MRQKAIDVGAPVGLSSELEELAGLSEGRAESPFIGECVDARHPSLQGRVLVRWADSSGRCREAWTPVLQGLTVRAADRVLLMRPANWSEAIVCGVVDGFARRPEPPRIPVASLTVERDEALVVAAEDGQPLLEIRRGDRGPVARLLCADLDLELPGELRISAKAIALRAREGEIDLRASGDVNVEGELIHLN